MPRANALRALDPMWFRFGAEKDKVQFGERWFRYDEGALLRKPARDLLEIERDITMPLIAATNVFREDMVLGDLVISWIAIREIDPVLAGEFKDYNPITNLIEWTSTEPEELGKDETPEMDHTSGNTTSETTDTVALQTMPISESDT